MASGIEMKLKAVLCFPTFQCPVCLTSLNSEYYPLEHSFKLVHPRKEVSGGCENDDFESALIKTDNFKQQL